ncbi:uncharacterized protein LOC133915022 [Phragmites australis]|uniref:uncharacterized protein LOC133915022 n=1 Tax=Phragmites australis TaxID=29695 RepID=UPI002D7979AF|nr:uncharacterized protein LOC133915022 [Phragmites australis]
MSHGGQPSCTTLSLGKYVRRARGKKRIKDKPEKKKKPEDPASASSGGVSMELTSAFSAEAGAAWRDSVVRVVLKSGVVEVYPGVVQACTVIRKHPPGLCLAHPDVFRNPHGAVVRPLEPLFPGQKFLLLPVTTVDKLKQKIPESSIGAFADEESDLEEEEEDEGSEEVTSEGDQDYSSGAAASSEDDQETAAGDGSFMPACSAREYYVANERWSECHFKKLVARGLAVEQSKEPERKERTKKKGTKKRKGKKRKDRRVAVPAGLRMFATPRRTWEPSLPSVDEEIISPLHPPSEATTDDHEQ